MFFGSKTQQTERQKGVLLGIAYLAVLAALLLAATVFALRFLLPFVLAFFTAALLQRPLRFLVKRMGGRRRYFSAALVIILVGLLAAAVILVGGRILDFCVRFFSDAQNLEQIRCYLSQTLDALSSRVTGWSSRLSPQLQAFLASLLTQAETHLYDMAGNLFSDAAQSLLSFLTASLPSFLLAFATWVLAAFFFTADYERITAFLLGRLPVRLQEGLCSAGRYCACSLGRILWAYLLLMVLTFAQLALGLWLLDVPGALWLAAVIAFVDLLPVLGTGTVLIPWALLAALTGNAVLGGGLALLFAVITVVRNILEPRLISRQIGLHPLAVLAAMYVGLKVAGLLGLLLFPLVLTVVCGSCLKKPV